MGVTDGEDPEDMVALAVAEAERDGVIVLDGVGEAPLDRVGVALKDAGRQRQMDCQPL